MRKPIVGGLFSPRGAKEEYELLSIIIKSETNREVILMTIFTIGLTAVGVLAIVFVAWKVSSIKSCVITINFSE